jgi:hypothetical protein
VAGKATVTANMNGTEKYSFLQVFETNKRHKVSVDYSAVKGKIHSDVR